MHSLVRRESLRLQRARRDSDLSGAHAVAALLKEDRVDRYGSSERVGLSQTELIADTVDEPVPAAT